MPIDLAERAMTPRIAWPLRGHRWRSNWRSAITFTSRFPGRWCLAACAGSVGAMSLGSCARAAEVTPQRLYEVTTEIGMPHLEENLRYTITHARRCLARADLSTLFWMLREPVLKGCRLVEGNRHADSISYRLVCELGHGTTGSATWQLGAALIQGTLNVKLGGKNMTFYQRITAKPLGDCLRDAK